MVLAVTSAGETALRKVDHYQFLDAELKNGARRVAQRNRVQNTFLANAETRHHSRLILIDNRVVAVLERWRHHGLEAVTCFTDHVDAGLHACRLSGRQQLGCGRGAVFGNDIHLVEQQQVAQMKDTSLDLREIEILTVPQRIGSAVVEEGALTVRLNGEDIGVTRFSLYGGLQVPGINLVLGTVFLDGGPHGIFAHETRTQKRKLHP